MIQSEDAFREVLEDDTLTLSSSSYGSILDCYQKGLWNIGFRRVSTYASHDMSFGSILHRALDVRQQMLDKPRDEALVAMESTIDEAYSGINVPDDEYRHSGRAKTVAGLYVDHYADDNKMFETVASEQDEMRTLGKVVLFKGKTEEREVEIKFRGIADGIWKDLETGAHCVKDTKTSKSDRVSAKQDEYKMSHQFKGYCWLFGEVYGERIRDVVVDLVVCRKPLLKMTPKSLPRDEFHRFVLSYTDNEIERFKSDVLGTAKHFLESSLYEDHAPMTGAPRGCVWPSRCPYYDVCDNDKDEDKLRWLGTAEFKDKETRNATR